MAADLFKKTEANFQLFLTIFARHESSWLDWLKNGFNKQKNNNSVDALLFKIYI